MAGIYKITSPSGAIYIGKTKLTFHERFRYYRRLHCKRQHKLYASFLKYGVDAHIFEIEEEFYSKPYMDYIDAFEECHYGIYKFMGCNMMNIREPGRFPKHTHETKLKISASLMGRRRTPESIKMGILTKIANNSTGKGVPKSPEAIQKVRQALTGRKIPSWVSAKGIETKRRNGTLFGRVCSEETRRKIGNGNRGKKRSDEQRRRMSEARNWVHDLPV